MAGLSEYLWWLLPAFLKKKRKADSLVNKLMNVFGEELDAEKIAIVDMRRMLLIAAAGGEYLDNHGRGRDLERIPGESDDDYRTRLISAYVVKKRGGTIPGMIEACAILGLEIEIRQFYQTDPGRWAEFEVRVIAGELKVLNQSIFYQTVRALKPAHTRAVFKIDIELDRWDDDPEEIIDTGNYFDEFIEV